MENTFDAVIKTLNKLIEINNDRTEGYETAAKETDDQELKAMFNNYASQSRAFRGELESLVKEHGAFPEKGTSASGKVYRAWMDAKAAVTGKNKKQIVSSCEFGEDAAKSGYAEAIRDAVGFPQHVVDTINRENTEIIKAHDSVKHLRDTMAA